MHCLQCTVVLAAAIVLLSIMKWAFEAWWSLLSQTVWSGLVAAKSCCRERQGRQLLHGGLELLPMLVEQDIGCSRYGVLGVNGFYCCVIKAVPGASSSLTVSCVVSPGGVAPVICHSVQIIYGRCHLQPNQRCVRLKPCGFWWFMEALARSLQGCFSDSQELLS